MGVQSSEMIDSKLIMYVLCPSLLLAATRIWARSDDKKCTVPVPHIRATHTCRSRALGVSNDGDVHLASIEMYTFYV